MQSAPAMVYLVGAGPGDPGLITLWGADCLRRADLVLYDYLANPALLDHAPEAAERVCLGHHRTGRTLPQAEVNSRMVEAARNGRVVVRLKGGDPSIFARTADELAALRAAGVPYEVVPGITAGLAAGCAKGSAVALLTGHERAGKGGAPFDYGALAHFPGALVLYMGVTSALHWSRAMMDRGLSPSTPITVVRRCRRPEQEVLHITLADVGPAAQRGAIRPPSVIVVDKTTEPPPLRGVLLAAHGACDDRTIDAARSLAARTAERLPGIPVEIAFLECRDPSIAEGLVRLATRGVRQATLVPLFLARGAHVARDIPAIVERVARKHSVPSVEVSRHVGAWPELLELAVSRTHEAMARCGAVAAHTALLLIAHGSRCEAALDETRRFAQTLASRLGVERAITAFAAMGEPYLDHVLPSIERLSVQYVAVYPHFLFPGQRVDTVRRMTETWRRVLSDRKWCIADPAGPALELAAAVARAAR